MAIKSGMKKMLGVALGIATLGIGGPGSAIQHQDAASKSQRTVPQKNKDLQNVPVKSARQFVREDAGGFQVMSYGEGIPPHI